VSGPSNVARFLLGVLTKRPGWRLVERPTADGLGLVLVDDDTVRGVLNLRVAGGVVTDVWIVLNPAKLAAWRA